MNLVANSINITRIEIIIIECMTDEVVDQIPLIFSEELAVDSLGECVCHEWCLRTKVVWQGSWGRSRPPCASSVTVQKVCQCLLIRLIGCSRIASSIPVGNDLRSRSHALANLLFSVPFLLNVGDVRIGGHQKSQLEFRNAFQVASSFW